MTDPHSASSIFPSFPRPFITISTRPALLSACQQAERQEPGVFTILSPLHAGAGLGLDWWLALVRDVPLPSILDCGTSIALALEALEKGIEGAICRTPHPGMPPDMAERLFLHRPPESTPKSILHTRGRETRHETLANSAVICHI